MSDAKRKHNRGGRPLKGDGLFFLESKRTWATRATLTIDGEKLRRVVELGTEDRIVARRKRAKVLAGVVSPAAAASVEKFADALERFYEHRKAAGVESARDEHQRLRDYALPHVGAHAVDVITAPMLNNVLVAVRDLGRSKQTIQHVRQTLHQLFAMLKREGAIKQSPMAEAEMPRMAAVPRKERVILTDEELAAYLAWVPEDERSRSGVLERQTLACVSRMFGGLRTGDLHALCWGQHVDCEAFTYGVAPRQKTATPQLLEIPALLRPILRRWWEQHGSPTEGHVFPMRTGPDAGEARRKQSHAGALKRDLMRMMGIEVLKRTITPDGKERLVWSVGKPPEAYNRRERELFTETSYSLPLDFHSFRRAFNTALADAGVNIQIAMRLAGHSNAATHQRYVMSRVRQMPDAALSNLDAAIRQTPAKLPAPEAANYWRSQRDLNPRYRRERPAS